jgi:hypothetical protein
MTTVLGPICGNSGFVVVKAACHFKKSQQRAIAFPLLSFRDVIKMAGFLTLLNSRDVRAVSFEALYREVHHAEHDDYFGSPRDGMGISRQSRHLHWA